MRRGNQVLLGTLDTLVLNGNVGQNLDWASRL